MPCRSLLLVRCDMDRVLEALHQDAASFGTLLAKASQPSAGNVCNRLGEAIVR